MSSHIGGTKIGYMRYNALPATKVLVWMSLNRKHRMLFVQLMKTGHLGRVLVTRPVEDHVLVALWK